MKISLNWLKNYIDVANIEPEVLFDTLTMLGLEVESTSEIGSEFEGLVVGEVIEKQKHPNADKLSLCTVSDGKENYQVVCGAPNVEKGQKIVFAPVGATIPEFGEKLKKTKIRGIESAGMICSEKELKLGDDHSGIMVLEQEATPGISILDYLKLKDVTIEIGITPNRPDALSHIGIGRDLAAKLKKNLNLPKIDLKESNHRIEEFLNVRVENEKDCPRYVARLIRNVKVKESPRWLKNYLLNVGLRPINNIVDISNFVMLERGQPLHTFDANLVSGKTIVVKNAKDGDEFITLDGKARILNSNTLMICDSEKPIAIAGVMGGENSGITENTKSIIIESAYFNPVSIRKTSKYLQLSTDSSYRFERGVDYENTLNAANRAAQLILELAGGELAKGAIDIYPEKIKNFTVRVRFDRINKVLGLDIKPEEVIDILKRLGFTLKEINNESFECEIPSFRPDCYREIDIIEEVARIYGYEKIPTIPKMNITPSYPDEITEFPDKIREILVGFGLFETMNNSLVNSEQASFNDLKGIRVLNPVSIELSHLRTSLIPGLLGNVINNSNKSEYDLRIFEIGNCFNAGKDKILSFNDFSESTHLGICLTGLFSSKNWLKIEIKSNIFLLKGLILSLFEKIYLDNIKMNSYHYSNNKFFDTEIKFYNEDRYLGSIYQLNKEYLKSIDISEDVICGEFDLNVISSLPKRNKKFVRLSNYPKVERDISFFVSNDVIYSDIELCIKRNADKLLIDYSLIDQYINEKTSENKSLSIRLVFQSFEKTLTSEEVEKRVKKIINGLEQEFRIQIRDSMK